MSETASEPSVVDVTAAAMWQAVVGRHWNDCPYKDTWRKRALRVLSEQSLAFTLDLGFVAFEATHSDATHTPADAAGAVDDSHAGVGQEGVALKAERGTT